MRICYLYLADYSSKKSGVDHKVIGKCRQLESMFPGSKFVRFTANQQHDPNDYFSRVSFAPPKKRLFNRYFYTRAQFAAIDKYIADNNNTFDFYILRYPFAGFSLLKLLKHQKGKILFEHNTNEREELKGVVKGNKKRIPFSFHPSVVAYYLESIFFNSAIEKYLGPTALKYAAGGLAVTPEIAEIEKRVYKDYKILVIPNGISPNTESSVTNRKTPEVLKGVFLAGTYSYWNGIERIIDSFLKSNVQSKMQLYFVGKIEPHLKTKFSQSQHDSLQFREYIDKSELDGFLGEMHFAIGTCAIHKKGLKEGAVLKVREYLSSGLPVVLGYEDPCLQSLSDLYAYCIQFPADDSDLDFDYINVRVREFYSNNPNLNTRIQELANKQLSWDEILKPLPKFLNLLK